MYISLHKGARVQPMQPDVVRGTEKPVNIFEHIANSATYAAALKLRATCESMIGIIQPPMPAIKQFMRALHSSVNIIRRGEPVVVTCTSFTCKDLTVSIEGPNCLRITCRNEKHPYVNDLSNIVQMENSDYQMDAAYTNQRTGNVVHTKLDVSSPWHVHGMIRNAEQILLGKL